MLSKVGHLLHIRYSSVSSQKVKPVGLVVVVFFVIVVVVIDVASVVELVVVGVVVVMVEIVVPGMDVVAQAS